MIHGFNLFIRCLTRSVPVGLIFASAIGNPLGVSAATKSADAPPLIDITTQHVDTYRTGWNANEHILNRSNVNVKQFGKLFTRKVDGQIYAQPLILSQLKFPGGTIHNVVFVATEHNSVYAFDADHASQSVPLWHVNLGPTAPWSDFYEPPMTDLNEEVGITSTPVIDRQSRTIYVEAKTKVKGKYFHYLHAIDFLTGKEKPGSPMLIQTRVKSKAPTAVKGYEEFDPRTQLQRPGLLLLNGVVYLGFGSHGDHFHYHGWLLGYDAKSLKLKYTFCTSPDDEGSAIWMAGQGPACDRDGNIYVSTGNGDISASKGGTGYGNSVLKLNFARPGSPIVDWFMPYNAQQLDEGDADLGASGTVLLPGRGVLFAGTKRAWIYIMSTNKMGHFNAAGNSNITQDFQVGNGHVHGSPVYCQDPVVGEMLYVWTENDHLRQYKIVKDRLNSTPVALSDSQAPPGMPGGFLTVTSNRLKPQTGIVWATRPRDDNANWNTVPGILIAFDSSNVNHELWNSTQNAKRDELGMFAKFNPPTVANGHVYTATFGKELAVYGLLPK